MQSLFFAQTSGANGAVAYTLAATNHSIMIHQVRLHLGAAGAAENFTATLDHSAGASFDCELFAESTNAKTSINHIPTAGYMIPKGTEVDFALANTNNGAWGLEIVYSILG